MHVRCTYDKQSEQNESPDGSIEWLEDTERVRRVDVDVRSPDDDRQAKMLERSDEVDDLLTCGCNRYCCSCQVRSATVVFLSSTKRHDTCMYYTGVNRSRDARLTFIIEV